MTEEEREEKEEEEREEREIKTKIYNLARENRLQNIINRNKDRYEMLRTHAEQTLHEWICWGYEVSYQEQLYEPLDKKKLLKKGLCQWCAVNPLGKEELYEECEECVDCNKIGYYHEIILKRYMKECDCGECSEDTDFPTEYARNIMDKSPEKFTEALKRSEPFFTCSECKGIFCEEGIKKHICLAEHKNIMKIALNDKHGKFIGHPYGCPKTGRLYTYNKIFGKIWLLEKELEFPPSIFNEKPTVVVRLEVDEDLLYEN